MFSLTWDNIESWDQIVYVVRGEKELIDWIEENFDRRCEHLKKIGNHFYYCGKDMEEFDPNRLEPSNPIYRRHVDTMQMQLHCMDRFEACCYYKGTLKP